MISSFQFLLGYECVNKILLVYPARKGFLASACLVNVVPVRLRLKWGASARAYVCENDLKQLIGYEIRFDPKPPRI